MVVQRSLVYESLFEMRLSLIGARSLLQAGPAKKINNPLYSLFANQYLELFYEKLPP